MESPLRAYGPTFAVRQKKRQQLGLLSFALAYRLLFDFLLYLHPAPEADQDPVFGKDIHCIHQLADGTFLPLGEFRRGLLHSGDHRFHSPDGSGVFFSLLLKEDPLLLEGCGLIQKVFQPVLVGFLTIVDHLGKQSFYLLVYLLQPFFDVRKAHGFTGDGGELLFHRLGHSPDEILFLPHGLIHSLQDGPLEWLLIQSGGVVAVPLSVVQAAHAPPHDAGLAVPSPGASPIESPAFPADQPFRKGVLAGIGSKTGGGCFGGALRRLSPCQLRLDRIEGLSIHDSRMMVLDKVLRQLAGVLHRLFADAVADESLLQDNVPAIFLVGKDAPDGGDAPFFFSSYIGDPLSLQPFFELPQTGPGQIPLVDLSYHLSLLGDDLGLAILSPFVGIQVFVVDIRLALPHGLADAPADIGGDGLALRLGKGSQQGEKHFTVRLQGVDVLLLEEHPDPMLFEQADIGEAVHRVPGEPGDGLGEDEVDLLLSALTNHPQELRALPGGCPGDALIRVDTRHGPIGIAHDLVGVGGPLGLIAGELLLIIGGFLFA